MEIKFYTVEEMIKDILNYENIPVTLTMKNVLFTKLYSEVFTKACESPDKVSEVKDKLKEILIGKHGNLITRVDRLPESKNRLTIYRLIKPIDWYSETQIALYVDGFDTIEASVDTFKYIKDPVIFAVDHQTKTVILLVK